jgi:hypothetical protein
MSVVRIFCTRNGVDSSAKVGPIIAIGIWLVGVRFVAGKPAVEHMQRWHESCAPPSLSSHARSKERFEGPGRRFGHISGALDDRRHQCSHFA